MAWYMEKSHKTMDEKLQNGENILFLLRIKNNDKAKLERLWWLKQGSYWGKQSEGKMGQPSAWSSNSLQQTWKVL